MNWLGETPLAEVARDGLPVYVRVRSTRAPQPATIFANGDRIEVEITGGEEGVAPGQACVVYENADPRARVLGGGIIRATVPMKLNAPLEAAE
jgi:tRNA-specific 2-thiouridylase